MVGTAFAQRQLLTYEGNSTKLEYQPVKAFSQEVTGHACCLHRSEFGVIYFGCPVGTILVDNLIMSLSLEKYFCYFCTVADLWRVLLMGETKDYIHANFANVRVLMLLIEY